MPYEIETKDGIVVRGIPDNVKPDDPSIKAKVANARQANTARQPSGYKATENISDELSARNALIERGVIPDPGMDPTTGMSRAQLFAAGSGKAISDTGLGIKQAASLVGIGNRAAVQDEVNDMRTRDAPLMNTVPGMAGNTLTQAGMAVAPGAAMARAPAAVGAAGRYLMASPSTLGGAVTQGTLGATQAGIQPVADGESRLMNIGAGTVAGAALPAFGMGGGMVKGAVEPLYAGGRERIVGRALNAAAGQDAPQVAQRLSLARSLVPGSDPTAGQAGGSAGIAAMERAASATDPQSYAGRLASQNDARVNALRDMAGTGGARDAVASRRDAEARKLYEQAYANGVDLSRLETGKSPFAKVEAVAGVNAPAGKEPAGVLSAIRRIGGIKNTDGTMIDITGETRTGRGIKGIPPGLFHKNGNTMDDLATKLRDEEGYLIPYDANEGGVEFLKNMIRDEINGTRKHLSGSEQDASFANMAAKRSGIEPPPIPKNLTRAGDKMNKLLERPALRQAVTEAKLLAENEGVDLETEAGTVKGLDYVKRALDDQIGAAQGNQQRILKALKDDFLTNLDQVSPSYAKARNTFSEMSKPINQMDIAQEIANKAIRPLDDKMTPAAFARALKDDTAARATGFNKATLSNTMDPAQLQALNAIKKDLANADFAQNAGRGSGSDTVQKLSMNNLMRQSGLPVGINNLPGLGRAGNWVYSQTDDLMKQRLAQALLDPKDTARLMTGSIPNAKRQALVNALRAGANPVAIGGTQMLLNAQQ